MNHWKRFNQHFLRYPDLGEGLHAALLMRKVVAQVAQRIGDFCPIVFGHTAGKRLPTEEKETGYAQPTK